ncbi:heparinase II/III-family protein, partial [Candidatus Pelagibacter sp.]|nr:heparinase II/III-family protein [Candidatus Pelagibacter sp.]
RNIEYKPSPSLLDCLIKYEKKKIKIEDLYLNSVWSEKNLNKKDNKNLHSFFWLFSLDLKSSKKITQSVIINWIENNQNYNKNNWDFNILSKRVIAWISNSKLTYEDSNQEYKDKFNSIIQKQVNHLINEIEKSRWVDDKMIGCAAIILSGLSFNDKEKYLNFGLTLLKKIINFCFDSEGFPKSRSIRQLNFYLKYFVLIREWFKESQNEIPKYLDEIIFYLGQSYSILWQGIKKNILFNGNHEMDNKDFDEYLINHNYKFKNNSCESGGYTIFKNKKTILAIDTGPSPEKKFSKDYQCGALSFEIISNNKKLICNSGYYQKNSHKLNIISKSSANHNTLIIDNQSSCKINSTKMEIETGLKILKKKLVMEKNYWNVCASHDGYVKEYGIIHEREIEFFPKENKFVGQDKLIKKNNFKSSNFEVRFHLDPSHKIMKTQDGKSILIDIENEGWKFTSEGYIINVETGLYFGKKNFFTENKNLFISGITQNHEQIIKWKFQRIA